MAFSEYSQTHINVPKQAYDARLQQRAADGGLYPETNVPGQLGPQIIPDTTLGQMYMRMVVHNDALLQIGERLELLVARLTGLRMTGTAPGTPREVPPGAFGEINAQLDDADARTRRLVDIAETLGGLA